jgi:hypothetical protein
LGTKLRFRVCRIFCLHSRALKSPPATCPTRKTTSQAAG